MRLITIKDGVVENVILVDVDTLASTTQYWEDAGYTVLIDVSASPGDTYDGTTCIPPVQTANRVISRLDYMDRFTDVELDAIYTDAKNTIAVEVWLERFKLASEINLDDERTVSGLAALTTAGLLAPGRSGEILT